MDEVRDLIEALIAQRYATIAELQQLSLSKSWQVSYVLAGCSIATTALVLSLLFVLGREVRRRTESERIKSELNAKLEMSVQTLQRQRSEMAALAEMSDMMQSAVNIEEALALANRFMLQLFPGSSGALYFTSASRDLLERVAAWGDVALTPPTFLPDQCWALRRGRVHVGQRDGGQTPCFHTPAEFASGICVPLMAQAEAQGILFVGFTESHRIGEEELEFLKTCAEQVSLAMTNLRLRDRLRIQATRDPLTGLFNRRYMQETLDREILRSAREQSSVGLLMADIDHFKKFNDTHGHAAGDLVIKEMARMLQDHVRGSDVACRYGGEEFVLIFPAAAKEVTMQRAELICKDARELRLRFEGVDLGVVTLSIGVAAFPLDANTAATLIQAADKALYQAKSNGRNQVIAAAEVLAT